MNTKRDLAGSENKLAAAGANIELGKGRKNLQFSFLVRIRFNLHPDEKSCGVCPVDKSSVALDLGKCAKLGEALADELFLSKDAWEQQEEGGRVRP